MSDRTVIPSHMDNGEGRAFWDGDAFGNFRLRMGEVLEKILPSDPRSASKKVNEYRVLVQHVAGGTACTRTYDYCTVSNLFGGGSDFVRYSYRGSKESTSLDEQRQFAVGKGAKVLLLCINGSTHNAVILGGIHDSREQASADQGHFLHFMFNGVEIQVQDDGTLQLVVHGPTDIDGNQTGDDLQTTLTVGTDGGVTLSSKADVNITCANAAIVASGNVQIGADDIADDPGAGVVLGSWIEPITGSPVYSLLGTSKTVTAKK